MVLNTSASLDLRHGRKRVRFHRGLPALLACVVLVALTGAGCGGGQIEGQEATAPATQASVATTTTPATTQPPATTTTERPARTTRTTTEPPSTTATTTTPTTTQPSTTTTTPTTPSTTATRPATTPKPAADPGRPIEETAQLTLESKASATEYTQRGTVTGTYDGEMALTAKITERGIAVRFTVTTPDGTVTGHGLAIVRITGAEMEPITGTASIDSGTGEFAGIHGTGLKVRGRVALDASRGVVHLTGTIFD